MEYISIKTLILLSVFTIGFSNFNKCDAQSVVGKWQRTGTKIFTTDKTTGKQVPAPAGMQQQYEEAVAKRGYIETLEFKSNNTYTSTVATSGGKPISHDGNYSISGNLLDMNIPLVNGEKTNITIQTLTDNKMIWDLVFMGKLTEIIYTKI
jgi:hypothetical protein